VAYGCWRSAGILELAPSQQNKVECSAWLGLEIAMLEVVLLFFVGMMAVVLIDYLLSLLNGEDNENSTCEECQKRERLRRHFTGTEQAKQRDTDDPDAHHCCGAGRCQIDGDVL